MIKGSAGTHHMVSKGAVRRKEVELSLRDKYKGLLDFMSSFEILADLVHL